MTATELPFARSLFVASLSEVSNNDLRVIVVEGVVAEVTVETPLGEAFPVRPEGRAFEITWWDYVAYSVVAESWAKPDHAGPSVRFGERKDSAYLRYILDSTWAQTDWPGPLSHWFIHTEFHSISVVSSNPPEIRELAADAVEWGLGERE